MEALTLIVANMSTTFATVIIALFAGCVLIYLIRAINGYQAAVTEGERRAENRELQRIATSVQTIEGRAYRLLTEEQRKEEAEARRHSY